jgi:hypothetical protein
MKTSEAIRSTPPQSQALLIAAFLALVPTAATLAQSPVDAGYTILARGPMEKLWAKLSWQTNRDGSVTTITNASFTEMADGLEYWDGQAGAWKDSQDLIEVQSSGAAAALHGRVKAFFSPNLNTPGAVTLVDSNRTFKCEPIGLFYYDAAQDKTVPLAVLKDCSAELLPPNQVVYESVLDKVSADYLVTYTKGAIEAELVLLQRPKPPEYYGLSSNSTTLEWWTQWQAPQPSQTPTPIVPELGFNDSLLDFGGGLIFPRGRAFATGNEPPRSPGTPAPVLRPGPGAQGFVPVGKIWNNVGASSVLVEGVLWTNIAPLLSSLPEVSQAGKPAAKERLLCLREAVGRRGQAEPAKQGKPVLLAYAAHYRPRGVALDYTIVQGGTTFLFGDAGGHPYTYYLTNTADFSGGTLTFEPNATIKYAPNTSIDFDASEGITSSGTQASNTVFTSRDDDLYGETLPDSNHQPSETDWVTALWGGGRSGGLGFKRMTFRWIYEGIVVQDYSPDTNNIELCTFQFSESAIDMQNNAVGNLQRSSVCNVAEPIDPNGGGAVYGAFDDVCANNVDANNDGVPDYWEYQWFGTTNVDLNADSDGDCTNNRQEYVNGTDPADFLHVTSCYSIHDYVTHAGDGTTLQVAANLPCASYQWYSNSAAIPGATTSSFTPSSAYDLNRVHATVFSAFYSTNTPDVALYVLDDLRWAMWTNFIRQTSTISGINNIYEAAHTHPTGWPNAHDPDVAWHANCFLYHYRGFTGISMCNAKELWSDGETDINVPPITALTDRIGYLRGHGIAGPRGLHVPSPGYTDDWNGTNIWFCDASNNVVKDVIAGAYVGCPYDCGETNPDWDFTLVFFETNLNDIGVSPIPFVAAPPVNPEAPYHICFKKTQNNTFDTGVPGFEVSDWGGENGNSGGPLLLPLPSGDLAFIGGITTVQMTGQATNNIQTALTNLFDYFSANPSLYQGSLDWQRDFQLNWYNP